MIVKSLYFIKFCHYTLKWVAFISLFILCHFLYMDEAIEKFKIKATTETKRDEERQFDIPSLTICAEPGFKPSISKKHNLSIPTRYLFYFKHYQFVRNISLSLIDVI